MGTIKNYTFNYTGSVQKFIAPYDGYYLFETWGARGQSILDGYGGYGGYAKGSMRIKKDTELYIYVGGAGWNGGWNGGGGGQAIGGGASDIRTVGGVWNDLTSLNSRIIVAGGGGAGERTTGGVGGGLVGGSSYGSWATYVQSGGGTQTSGGVAGESSYGWGINGGFGYGGTGAVSSDWGSGGGGGWYGGGSIPMAGGGGGGSSYTGNLINAFTTAGVNSGDGKVTITCYDKNVFVFFREGLFYIPQKETYDMHNNKFKSLTKDEIIAIANDINYSCDITTLIKPFVFNGEVISPSKLMELTKYKLCIFTIGTESKININYIPSNVALYKTNVKVENKYTPVHDELEPTFLDINSNNKSKIDYFLDFGKNEAYKNCSVLDGDIIINDFYLNLKFNSYDGIFNSITLYGKNNDKYTKLKSTNINVYDNFNFEMLICFKENYEEVLVNKIVKQSMNYTIDTLDKF